MKYVNGEAVEETAEDIAAQAAAQAEVVQARIPAIKAEAGRRITAKFPEWKQRNMIARTVEISQMASQSADDLAELAEMQEARAWVQSVRAASDVLESDPPADYMSDSHWPDSL